MLATTLTRVFQMDVKGQKMVLADPNQSFSPEAVLGFYTNTYPELVTAKIEGPKIKDDEVLYKFVSTIGTKG